MPGDDEYWGHWTNGGDSTRTEPDKEDEKDDK